MKGEGISQSPVYGAGVMELVTVAVEYCAFVERSSEWSRLDFSDKVTKLLALLYVKAATAPKYEMLSEYCYLEDFVTEDNYDAVRRGVSAVMSDRDDYLDVFMEDMKYSDSPILTTVSENLADIYQELKNFVLRYKNAADEEMAMDSLAEMKEGFECGWGQKMVNVLRALHEVRYSEQDEY